MSAMIVPSSTGYLNIVQYLLEDQWVGLRIYGLPHWLNLIPIFRGRRQTQP
jgi:hypothetical protein